MGKKSKKSRRQPTKEKKVAASQSPQVMPQENNASIENVDDGVTVVKGRKPCPHLHKGVDFDNLLTKLRSSEPIKCEACREGGNHRRGNKERSKHGSKKGSASADSKSQSKAIWVCLGCGQYVCAGVGSPTASTTHAIHHIRKTHHRLMIRWDNPQLMWCFICSAFIPVEKTEKNDESKDPLFEVVKLIKERSSGPSAADVEDVWFGSGSVTSAIKSEGGTVSGILDGNRGYVVRGLVNLGNTCFFNSVMQNLLALDRLRDYFFNLDASVGQLTISLKKLFAETKPEMGLKNAINPKPFFGYVCAKAPQFRGYQQHDSHELLRCLLDGLYTEELALKKHIASKSDVVSANQDPTFVDAVFGGQISSTLCCVECGHSSTVYEPFLDLSLSVPTKKTLSKKAQLVSRAKKTKLPPKKVGRARGKVNRDADRAPAQGVTVPSPSSESPALGHVAVPQTETTGVSSGYASLLDAVGSSTEANDFSSTLQNQSAVTESETGQVLENTVKENAAGVDDFAWMDYIVTENTENTAAADEFTWTDYLEPGTRIYENDLVSQNNDISPFQDSEDKNMVLTEDLAESSQVSLHEGELNRENMVLTEDLAESSQVSLHEGELNWETHDSPGNLHDEDRPLLVQDSQVLFLPYKEESISTEESVRENEASSSNAGHGQDEVEFDGFGDMFNEPEIAAGPSIGPSLANEVAETGFLTGNIGESDPDEVDDSNSPVSVESCLAHFVKPELLSDDNAWNCENCAKILQRQKLEAKKKQANMSKHLANGGETQSQCEPPTLNKELPCSNGVGTISNGGISSSSESMVLQNEVTDSLKQHCIKIENSQTGELDPVVCNCDEEKSSVEEASLMKSNSSVSSKLCGQEEPGDSPPVNSSNAENHSGYNKFQQRNTQRAENCQSRESEDEEVDSKNVKVKRNATKRVLINRAPPVLTIHLKRFSQDARGRLSKLNGHVNFSERIDLRPYVDPRYEDRDNCIYLLVGVVEHSGTMRGGHYIAYVKGGEKRKGKAESEPVSSPWYYVSDNFVRQVSLEEVLRCEAYILFYERI